MSEYQTLSDQYVLTTAGDGQSMPAATAGDAGVVAEVVSVRWSVRPSLPRLTAGDHSSILRSGHSADTHGPGDHTSSYGYTHSPGAAEGLLSDLGHTRAVADQRFDRDHFRDRSDPVQGQGYLPDRPAVGANWSSLTAGDRDEWEVGIGRQQNSTLALSSIDEGGRPAEVTDLTSDHEAPPGLYCEVTDVDRQGLLRSRCVDIEALTAR